MDAEQRSIGRPRDGTIDERVLAAARQLLVEAGFEATTVQAIAERSGVHTSAIYRRWSSRIAIVEQVVFPGFDGVTVKPTGDLLRDVGSFVRAYQTTLGAPEARAAIPGLLASYQGSSSRRPEAWLAVSARPQFLDIVRAAPASQIDPAVDLDDVFDMLLGSMVARILVPTVAERRRSLDRVVDLVVRMLAPYVAGGSSAGSPSTTSTTSGR